MAIDPKSQEEREQHTGRELHRGKDAEFQRGARHFIDEPLLRGELDPKADERNPLHEPKNAIIAIGERREKCREFHNDFFGSLV